MRKVQLRWKVLDLARREGGWINPKILTKRLIYREALIEAYRHVFGHVLPDSCSFFRGAKNS